MSNIKAILFDFGGTLDSDGIDWFSRLYQGITSRCAGLDREVFQQCADQAANVMCTFPDTGRLTMAETVRRWMELIRDKLLESGAGGVGALVEAATPTYEWRCRAPGP